MEMLIEQIIEFKLRVPGPPRRTCIPTTVFFCFFFDKQKIFKKNFRGDYYLLLKYCKRQCTVLPSN